ncbi:hypothetical protein [Nonomuraea bangladeshensis]|uniref:hypothetical protein n=1 Tax=Nonomuraea bangladeshensis TaxID=404385 RepID=UPI003C306332
MTEHRQAGDFSLLLDLYLRDYREDPEAPAPDKFALMDAIASELAIADQRAKVLLSLLSLEADRLISQEDVQAKVIVSHLQNKTPLQRKKTALYELIKRAPDAGEVLTDFLQREQKLLQQAAEDPHATAAYRLAAHARVIQMRAATKRFIRRFNRVPITALLPFGAIHGKITATSSGATGAAAAGAAGTAGAAGAGATAAGTAGAASLGTAAISSGGGATLVGAAGQVIAQVAGVAGITMTQAATAVAATGLVGTAPILLDAPREPAPIVMLADPPRSPDPAATDLFGIPTWPDPTAHATPTTTLPHTTPTPTPSPTTAKTSSLAEPKAPAPVKEHTNPHTTSPTRKPTPAATASTTATPPTPAASPLRPAPVAPSSRETVVPSATVALPTPTSSPAQTVTPQPSTPAPQPTTSLPGDIPTPTPPLGTPTPEPTRPTPDPGPDATASGLPDPPFSPAPSLPADMPAPTTAWWYGP